MLAKTLDLAATSSDYVLAKRLDLAATSSDCVLAKGSWQLLAQTLC